MADNDSAGDDLRTRVHVRVKKLDEVNAPRPADVATEEIERFIAQSKGLVTQSGAAETALKTSESGSKQAIEVGHQKLYAVLRSIYEIGLKLEESPAKAEVMERMRKEIKEDLNSSVDPKAPLMAVLVKYIVRGAKKQLAHIYSRGLGVAQASKMTADALTAALNKHGVGKLSRTPEQIQEEKRASEALEHRMNVLRKLIRRLADDAGPVEWQHGVVDLSQTAPGELLFFIGVGEGTDTVKLAYGLQVEAALENGIIAQLSSQFTESNEELSGLLATASEKGLRLQATAGRSKRRDHELRT
jgi:phosphoglycolate phosphatase-like HAD superfamily hydrolase